MDFHAKRQPIDFEELRRLRRAGSVYLDTRRRRPRWFDGRFLKAQDLSRETEYLMTRQADLAVATGTGVVEGLQVERVEGQSGRLLVRAGFGVTTDGERVVLANDLDIDVTDSAGQQSLNTKVGQLRRPAPPIRTRSGVFLLVLRALEYTANRTAAYPTDVGGERGFQDGDVIEATAVSLVPYHQPSGLAESSERRRAEIADDLFTEQAEMDIPAASLPLALVELSRGSIQWIDMHLVRRSMGASFSDVLGFGLVPRPLRHAHFKQYDAMLDDVLESRRNLNAPGRFGAAEHFVSLPAAGRMPSACVDMDSFTQYFFPQAVDVEISVIPEDEIPQLAEESMLLPPIELTEDEEALASTSVLVMVPVPRRQFHTLSRRLRQVPIPLQIPGRRVRSTLQPIDFMRKIEARLPDFSPAPSPLRDRLNETSWQGLIGAQPFLWFIRRRNLSYKESVVGQVVRVMADEFTDETEMRRYQRTLDLYDDFTHLKVAGSAAADLGMVRLLTIPKFVQSETLMRSALREFQAEDRLDEHAVSLVSERFAGDTMGEGVSRLEASIAVDTNKARKLADSYRVPEMDYIARALPEQEFSAFAEALDQRLGDDGVSAEAVAEFIESTRGGLEQ